jgi:hypothetical protein
VAKKGRGRGSSRRRSYSRRYTLTRYSTKTYRRARGARYSPRRNLHIRRSPSVIRQPASLVSPSSNKQRGMPSIGKTSINKIVRAMECARRKIRKEVIFAKTGGGAGKRPPKYRETSKIKC